VQKYLVIRDDGEGSAGRGHLELSKTSGKNGLCPSFRSLALDMSFPGERETQKKRIRAPGTQGAGRKLEGGVRCRKLLASQSIVTSRKGVENKNTRKTQSNLCQTQYCLEGGAL